MCMNSPLPWMHVRKTVDVFWVWYRENQKPLSPHVLVHFLSIWAFKTGRNIYFPSWCFILELARDENSETAVAQANEY